jgi:hypothetical protein
MKSWLQLNPNYHPIFGPNCRTFVTHMYQWLLDTQDFWIDLLKIDIVSCLQVDYDFYPVGGRNYVDNTPYKPTLEYISELWKSQTENNYFSGI